MTPTRPTNAPSTDLFAQISLHAIPILNHLAEALQRWRIRRSYGRMSEAQLRDIGLTAYELEAALSLPFKESASDALAKAAAAEAAKW